MFAFILAVLLLPHHASRATINHALGSTVLIYGDVSGSSTAEVDDLGSSFYGSGTLIGYDHGEAIIATARHCVAPSVEGTESSAVVVTPTPAYVEFFDGAFGRIEKIRASKNSDLAIITVHVDRDEHPAMLSEKEPERGQPVFVVGMPFGQFWSYTEGYSIGGSLPPIQDVLDASPQWAKTFSISCASCGPGDSGGGVYNTNGDLIGILVAGGPAEEVNLIEPTSLVEQTLTDSVRVSQLPAP